MSALVFWAVLVPAVAIGLTAAGIILINVRFARLNQLP